jgi:hypothetical protein
VCSGSLTVDGIEVRAHGVIYDECARDLVGGCGAADVYSLATRAIRHVLYEHGLQPAEGKVTLQRPDPTSVLYGQLLWGIDGLVVIAVPSPHPLRLRMTWQVLS